MRYSQIGQQKCFEQSQKRYGSRISILGLWQEGESFEYGLVQGGFKGQGVCPDRRLTTTSDATASRAISK